MPVFHTKTIESILEPVAQQVSMNWTQPLRLPVAVVRLPEDLRVPEVTRLRILYGLTKVWRNCGHSGLGMQLIYVVFLS